MAERYSFTTQQLDMVADEVDSKVINRIPTRRGGVAIADSPAGKLVLKLADLANKETETRIAPSRSHGIANEVQMLRALPAGVAPSVSLFRQDNGKGLVYSATEYIGGRAATNVYLGLPARQVVHGLLQAVHRLHKNEMIHGDIQPGNLLFPHHEPEESIPAALMIDYELSKPAQAPTQGLPGLYHFHSPEAAAQLLEQEKL
jgi:serine/threonine protein kinase